MDDQPLYWHCQNPYNEGISKVHRGFNLQRHVFHVVKSLLSELRYQLANVECENPRIAVRGLSQARGTPYIAYLGASQSGFRLIIILSRMQLSSRQ